MWGYGCVEAKAVGVEAEDTAGPPYLQPSACSHTPTLPDIHTSIHPYPAPPKEHAIKTSTLCIACVILASTPTGSFGAASIDEAVRQFTLSDPAWIQKHESMVVTLANDRIAAGIAPDVDGNIISFVDKTRPTSPFSRLDDSFATTGQWKGRAYTYHIDERGPDRAAVTLETGGTLTPWPLPSGKQPPAADLTLKKTISVDGLSSRLRVDVTITNVGSTPVHALRYMAHALYSYKYLPGGTCYVFLPLDGQVRMFDYDRIVKDKFLASHLTTDNPFARWSPAGVMPDKGRYPAEGWSAMYSDSGWSYLSYDPAQFDFISFYTGTHPGEWLTMEPNTRAADLAPGQSVHFSYSLVADSDDVPMAPATGAHHQESPTIAFEPPAVPEAFVPGTPFMVRVRAATVLDRPQDCSLRFTIQPQHGKPVYQQRLAGTIRPFLATEIAGECAVPATVSPGNYEWRVEDAGGTVIGKGTLQALRQGEALNPSRVPAPTTDTKGFPPSAWTNSVGIEFVRIPAGQLMMGSDDSDPQAMPDEEPRHKVRITHDFLMSRFEVTNAEFRLYQPGYHASYTSENSIKKLDLDGDTQPAILADSWYRAHDFCKWLNQTDTTRPAGWEYRFPTEAEWEYAARGPQSLRYPWGNTWDSTRCNFGDTTGRDGFAATAPVGSYHPSGDSPFGVSDMAGNLYEWCEDYYDPTFYRHSPVDDPVNMHGEKDYLFEGNLFSFRVARGGGWGSLPGSCRSAFRYSVFGTNAPIHGIRLVLARVGK